MVIFLDTGPLGLLTHPRPKNTEVADWYDAHIAAGSSFVVPAVADYELRREYLRRNATAALKKLNAFVAAPGRYLPLTDAALKLAATFWADVRNAGGQTADNRELDCDALIAAQAKNAGLPDTGYVVATVNVGHLTRFIPATDWNQLAP